MQGSPFDYKPANMEADKKTLLKELEDYPEFRDFLEVQKKQGNRW